MPGCWTFFCHAPPISGLFTFICLLHFCSLLFVHAPRTDVITQHPATRLGCDPGCCMVLRILPFRDPHTCTLPPSPPPYDRHHSPALCSANMPRFAHSRRYRSTTCVYRFRTYACTPFLPAISAWFTAYNAHIPVSTAPTALTRRSPSRTYLSLPVQHLAAIHHPHTAFATCCSFWHVIYAACCGSGCSLPFHTHHSYKRFAFLGLAGCVVTAWFRPSLPYRGNCLQCGS